MVLVQGGSKGGVVADAAAFFRAGRAQAGADEVVVFVGRLLSLAPDPPCHDQDTDQQDGPSNADHGADDDPLLRRLQTRAGVSAIVVVAEAWSAFGGGSGGGDRA